MSSPYSDAVRRWYSENARDLPWRRPDATPWSVMVSEFMLQQTPVSRVLPAHARWLERWPDPAALAAATPADAVRQWDCLGYPRRAVRLHAAAAIITSEHDGRVPELAEQLRSLPGIGSYTAAAIASFAYGRRHAVLDTNVRRVLARLVTGAGLPRPAQTAAEVRLAESLLPEDGAGGCSVVCRCDGAGRSGRTAARPRCADCPLAAGGAGVEAGPAFAPGAPQPGCLFRQ